MITASCSMANYDKNLTQKWFTQDPRPKPVLLLVAAMLILITKPYWSIISFDHDFVATAKRRTIRFVAFVILSGLDIYLMQYRWLD